ncbi:MAG: hypothetical protein ACRDJG_11805, partial [Actinomycetota bacterium]
FISRLKENANPEITATLRPWRGRSVPLVGPRLRDVIARRRREVLDVEVAFRHRAYGGRQSGARRSLRLVGVRNDDTGRYHLYLTNIPPDRLTAEQVARVYAGRWQIGASRQGRITQSVKDRPRLTDSKPRSTGGAVARKQDGQALRQHSRKGGCATLQVAM